MAFNHIQNKELSQEELSLSVLVARVKELEKIVEKQDQAIAILSSDFKELTKPCSTNYTITNGIPAAS